MEGWASAMQHACWLRLAARPESCRRKGWAGWRTWELCPSCPVAGRAGLGLSGCQHPESSPGDPPHPHPRLPALSRGSPHVPRPHQNSTTCSRCRSPKLPSQSICCSLPTGPPEFTRSWRMERPPRLSGVPPTNRGHCTPSPGKAHCGEWLPHTLPWCAVWHSEGDGE